MFFFFPDKLIFLFFFSDLKLSDHDIWNYALWEIENILLSSGKSLRDYAQMPFPEGIFEDYLNRLIQDEKSYDREALKDEHDKLMRTMTDEQRGVYDTIMDAVDGDDGGIFFLYGCGGTGKTFLWRALSAAMRSKGEICLTVASSGIASLIIPGGRTAHSRFKIPINLNEDSVCHIAKGSLLADLIRMTDLIIWDEAPMMNRYCFEALDRTMKDIMDIPECDWEAKPFGGKTVVFGGDFRYIIYE